MVACLAHAHLRRGDLLEGDRVHRVAECEQRHVFARGAQLPRDLERHDAVGAPAADQIRTVRTALADHRDDCRRHLLERHARLQTALEDRAERQAEEWAVVAHCLGQRHEGRAAVEPQQWQLVAQRLERYPFAEIGAGIALDPLGELLERRRLEEFGHADAAAPLLLDPHQ